MIIAVVNQKGGVGKTTIALDIAAELALQGAEIFMVDADPQSSARTWAAIRKQPPLFPVVGLDRPTIHHGLSTMAADYDHVVIDAPPGISTVTRSAMLASDVVLIPVQPSSYDVWASAEIVRLVQEVSAQNENLQAAFVINRKIANTILGRDVAAALATYEPRVLRSTITQRVAFAESAATGRTVMETESRGSASREMQQLVQELLDLYA